MLILPEPLLEGLACDWTWGGWISFWKHTKNNVTHSELGKLQTNWREPGGGSLEGRNSKNENECSIAIPSLEESSLQLFWGMHTHSFQTSQNPPHMEGYLKHYQTLNPMKVQRPPRLVVCVHSKQLRRRFKSSRTSDQTFIHIPSYFQSPPLSGWVAT